MVNVITEPAMMAAAEPLRKCENGYLMKRVAWAPCVGAKESMWDKAIVEAATRVLPAQPGGWSVVPHDLGGDVQETRFVHVHPPGIVCQPFHLDTISHEIKMETDAGPRSSHLYSVFVSLTDGFRVKIGPTPHSGLRLAQQLPGKKLTDKMLAPVALALDSACRAAENEWKDVCRVFPPCRDVM